MPLITDINELLPAPLGAQKCHALTAVDLQRQVAEPVPLRAGELNLFKLEEGTQRILPSSRPTVSIALYWLESAGMKRLAANSSRIVVCRGVEG